MNSFMSQYLQATRFLIGSDEHTVHCYQLEDGEKDVQIASFASEVTCMDISLDGTPADLETYLSLNSCCAGTFIAAGSADHVARVIRFDPKDGIVGETFSYFGHSAPLISVALDPRGKYVASSSTSMANMPVLPQFAAVVVNFSLLARYEHGD